MRTTINLPDRLAEAAKRRAAADGRTFTSLVEEALRALLSEPAPPESAIPLPSYGRPDRQALIDLEDPDELWRALDGHEAP